MTLSGGTFNPAPAFSDSNLPVGSDTISVSYLGDASNAPSANSAQTPLVVQIVNPATPTLTTTASGSIVIGGVNGGPSTVSDSGVLAGSDNGGGTITFGL